MDPATASIEILSRSAPPADARVPYGPDPHQFGEARVPKRVHKPPVVIMFHGGYWRSAFSLDITSNMCAALTAKGVVTWNVEYRRLGNPGGGWPGTLDDAAAGVRHADHLARQHGWDKDRMVVAGHSAGGQLALYAAWKFPGRLRGVAPLAPVADLRSAYDLNLSDGVTQEFLGGSPEQVPERYHAASPIELAPLHVPQRVLHGEADPVVPISLSERYVAAARSRGDDARLIRLPQQGHFELIDPLSEIWPTVQLTILELLA